MPDTPDVPADSSTATVAAPTDPVEAPLPEGTKAETAKRFQDLLEDRKGKVERLKAYEQYGSPEDIATLVQRAKEIDAYSARIAQLEAEREAGQPKTTEQKELESLRTKARTELREIDPAIAKGEWAAAIVEQEYEGLEEDALEAQVDLMKKHGMTVTDQDVNVVGNYITAEIKSDRRLLRTYRRDPGAAVEKAFDKVMSRFTSLAERHAKAKIETEKATLAKLPPKHGPGGGPTASEPPKQPQTVAEAVRNSLAIWRERGG